VLQDDIRRLADHSTSTCTAPSSHRRHEIEQSEHGDRFDRRCSTPRYTARRRPLAGVRFGNPNRTPQVQNERARVVEGKRTGPATRSPVPGPPGGFCGVNPLRDYALEEIARCAKDPHLRTVSNFISATRTWTSKTRDTSNDCAPFSVPPTRIGWRFVVHLRPTLSRQRPYGAAQARAFLDNVLPSAPDIVVQIAHLAGAVATMIRQSMRHSVFTLTPSPPAIREWTHVYFEVSGVAGVGEWRGKADRIAARIRQLGIARILYGSDSAGRSRPETCRSLGVVLRTALSREELRAIAANVAPYLADRQALCLECSPRRVLAGCKGTVLPAMTARRAQRFFSEIFAVWDGTRRCSLV
jgi:hypothetical protein